MNSNERYCLNEDPKGEERVHQLNTRHIHGLYDLFCCKMKEKYWYTHIIGNFHHVCLPGMLLIKITADVKNPGIADPKSYTHIITP